MKKLEGKKALITGASQGLGVAIAQSYLAEGAKIMICARSEKELAKTAQALRAQYGESQVFFQAADVSRPAEVESLVAKTLKVLGGIDILVCNAGIYGPKGAIQDVDWQEWEDAIRINLMGTVLPCRMVVPHLIKQKSGKIITLSGGGATKPLPFISAYAASKAAVVRFSETLAEEVKSHGIDVNSVAPGALNTRLLAEVLEAGPDVVGDQFYQQSLKQKAQGGAPLEKGADLCVFLASAKSNGITGRLISAVWDPWERFPELKKEFQETDIYTLRRIVPEDRGQSHVAKV